ncbi:MAG: AlpA family transcriptional regulator [Pseudomonadota bacterium]
MNTQLSPETVDRILLLPEVMHLTGKGKTAIYADMKEGRFPAQIQIGKRSVGWLSTEIEAWIVARAAARNITG